MDNNSTFGYPYQEERLFVLSSERKKQWIDMYGNMPLAELQTEEGRLAQRSMTIAYITISRYRNAAAQAEHNLVLELVKNRLAEVQA